MRKGLHLLISSGLLLAITTALFYCMGIAYHNGYLTILNLDIYVLERSFNLTLYSGFLLFSDLISNLLVFINYCFLLFLVISILLIITFLINKKFKINLIDKCIQIAKQTHDESKEDTPPLTKIDHYGGCFLKICKYFIILLIIYISILVILFIPERKGKELAEATLKILENPANIQENKLISVLIREEKLKLYYLDCGSSFCAGIDLKTREVYYFPRDQFTYTLPPRKQ